MRISLSLRVFNDDEETAYMHNVTLERLGETLTPSEIHHEVTTSMAPALAEHCYESLEGESE